MQPHDFHQHLVGVCRAIECAGARTVVGFRFRDQQFRTPNLAFGIKLTGLGFLIVRQAARHGTSRNEHRRQMPERQGADD